MQEKVTYSTLLLVMIVQYYWKYYEMTLFLENLIKAWYKLFSRVLHRLTIPWIAY